MLYMIIVIVFRNINLNRNDTNYMEKHQAKLSIIIFTFLYLFVILSFLSFRYTLNMFCAFYHGFFFLDYFTWTIIFYFFSIVSLFIVMKNVCFTNNFAYIFRVLYNVSSCVTKWWDFTAVLGVMLLYAFCYVRRNLFCRLFLCCCIDTIFGHCIRLSLIIGLWF